MIQECMLQSAIGAKFDLANSKTIFHGIGTIFTYFIFKQKYKKNITTYI